MPTYRKLVRDKVPEILEKSGKNFEVETLNHDRYIIELRKKLQEELLEYLEAANPEDAVEKLAEMLEVMYHLSDVHETTMEEIEALRVKKKEENGSFEEKVFLIKVDD